MTCREFKEAADSLPLKEFERAQDARFLAHAQECRNCEAWMQDHYRLTGALHALRLTTADCEAGPAVEQALLRAFRQGPVPVVEAVAPRWNPFALRLSRWFEAGAYVAAAAALVLAMFVGYRVLHQPARAPVAQQAAPASQPEPNRVSGSAAISKSPLATGGETARTAGRRANPLRSGARSGSESSSTDFTEQTVARADYVDLMFCDPLSCSSDAHVVRMELPAAGASDSAAQTVMADVVVGDDGLVRAVRIVN